MWLLNHSFIKLAEAGALDLDFAKEIASSTSLRNRIVHEYETVDQELVHASIGTALEQNRRYVGEIREFLRKQNT